VDDTLGANVAERSGGHLAVQGATHSVEPLVLLTGAVVGDHHAVGEHGTGSLGVAGEESGGVSGAERQGLGVGHDGQVVEG